MTITKKAVIFVAFQSFLYLAASFVAWDLLWVENLSDFYLDQRVLLLFFWLTVTSAMLGILFSFDLT